MGRRRGWRDARAGERGAPGAGGRHGRCEARPRGLPGAGGRGMTGRLRPARGERAASVDSSRAGGAPRPPRSAAPRKEGARAVSRRAVPRRAGNARCAACNKMNGRETTGGEWKS